MTFYLQFFWVGTWSPISSVSIRERKGERQRQAKAEKKEDKRVKDRGGKWKEEEGKRAEGRERRKKGKRRGRKQPNRPGTKTLKQWLYPLINTGFLGHLTGSASILCTYFWATVISTDQDEAELFVDMPTSQVALLPQGLSSSSMSPWAPWICTSQVGSLLKPETQPC